MPAIGWTREALAQHMAEEDRRRRRRERAAHDRDPKRKREVVRTRDTRAAEKAALRREVYA